jgi:hypothetical protein
VQTLHSGWDVNATYYHAFRNLLTGPWLSPAGADPGTSVTSRMSEDSLTVGLARNFQYGKGGNKFPHSCNVLTHP